MFFSVFCYLLEVGFGWMQICVQETFLQEHTDLFTYGKWNDGSGTSVHGLQLYRLL